MIDVFPFAMNKHCLYLDVSRPSFPRMIRHTLLVGLLCLWFGHSAFLAAVASDENWSQFRGPGGNAIAAEQSIPLEFGPEKNVLWKSELPSGHSSPCIWRDRIFLTGHVGTSLKMICLKRSDGSLLWERERIIPKLAIYEHVAGSPAASTPATNGERVCFYFDDYGMVVTDLDGALSWEIKFSTSTGNSYSYGASPVLDDGRIYLNRDGGIDSGLICLDVQNGDELWRVSRPDNIVSFSTPYILEGNGAKQILAGGTGQLNAFDALSGESIWDVTGLPIFICPSPVAADGMIFYGAWTTAHVAGRTRMESVFDQDSHVSPESMKDPVAFFEQFDANKDGQLVSNEFPPSRARDAFNFIDANKNGFVEMAEFAPTYEERSGPPGRNVLLGIAAGGRGDVTATHVKWEATKGLPYVASPLAYRGRLYLAKAGGFFSCLDPVTGEAMYESERLGVAGEYYATPVAVGNHLIVCSQRGTVLIIKAGDELEIVARNTLGEGLFATPAVLGNTLYIRGDKHLWAFAE